MKRNLLDQWGRVCVSLLTALITLFYSMDAFPQNPPNDPSAIQAMFEYSNDASTVVVSYIHKLGGIGGADKGPSLKIYGDGHMVVYYPPYMKKAGEYTLQLTQGEMNRLLRSLIAKKVLEFDAQAVRRSKLETDAATESSQPTFYSESDAPTTTIVIRLTRYTPAGSFAQEIVDLDKKASWTGLGSDARRYPAVNAIQGLRAAEQELQALMKHQDLKKIK